MKGFVRPDAIILPEDAVIPDKNLISPAPNQFTHELTRQASFYYNSAQQGTPPDGEFSSGAKVVLLVYDGGSSCRVADGRGLYVEIEYDALKKLRQ